MNISNSKLDVYNLCSKKYKIKYIEGMKPNITYSALLFGGAIDRALNYLLLCKRDNIPHDLELAYKEFLEGLNEWDGKTTLEYYKSEMPEVDEEAKYDPANLQVLVWQRLAQLGEQMIDTYAAEILPKIKRVIEVQSKKTIDNGDGDILDLVVDFIAEWEDGRIVLFDNKTASTKYPKNRVIKSQQLSLYSEYFDNKYCGYIVLLKRPSPKGELYQILIDEIPEEQTQKSFDLLEESLYNIKQGKFEKNPKSCFAMGKRCEYYNYCHNQDLTGLTKKKGY